MASMSACDWDWTETNMESALLAQTKAQSSRLRRSMLGNVWWILYGAFSDLFTKFIM